MRWITSEKESTFVKEIMNAVYDGQLWTWDDEVDVVSLGKRDKMVVVGVRDICCDF